MVVEVKPIEEDPEIWASKVFLKSIEILGGLKKLAEYRTLTWLPSLARAALAVVLREVFFKVEDEIAEYIGLTRQTVRNILRADPEAALEKLRAITEFTEQEKKDLSVHLAGGIAKYAFKLIKEEGAEPQLFLSYSTEIAKALDVPWAYLVLKEIKGIDFPITEPAPLLEKLKGLKLKDRPAEEIISQLEFPIKNPAELLHKIREVLGGS